VIGPLRTVWARRAPPGETKATHALCCVPPLASRDDRAIVHFAVVTGRDGPRAHTVWRAVSIVQQHGAAALEEQTRSPHDVRRRMTVKADRRTSSIAPLEHLLANRAGPLRSAVREIASRWCAALDQLEVPVVVATPA